MDIIQAYEDYLSLEKNYSVHTITAYMKDLNAFKEYGVACFGEDVLLDCEYSYVRSWIVSLSESGLQARTINRKVSSLKRFYTFLLKVEKIKVSPLAKHKALKQSKKVQVPFSNKEMEVVLQEGFFERGFEGVRDRLIIELFYATGIRRAELIALQDKDIDFKAKTLKVLGKRNKERIIPLTSKLLLVFKEYYEERQKLFGGEVLERIFVTKKGTKVYGSLVYRIINLYFSRASSKLKKSPHVLRHTFATHLLNEGANLNAVKELLGHSSLAATQVYTHNSIAKLKEVHGNSHPRNLRTDV